ncbi:hypothetical protein WR25_02785 [Diploscapter pachys]|uniref:Uncharacterized protein n=1 Tax=Diploscapter pachys TaxID=2018661 RepID=A0A2A2KMK2_9BILA|nr:hypothetical protein WR25_02785 [Diploscapter pachys]
MVLLLCQRSCHKHRTNIPQWIRKFNIDHGYKDASHISYHFYSSEQPLSVLHNTSLNVEFYPNLVYIISRTPHIYNGDMSDRNAIFNWLNNLDKALIIVPKDHQQLESYLSNTFNCSAKYIGLMNDEIKCPLGYFPNIARITAPLGLQAIHIQQPLTAEMLAVITRRLPKLFPKRSCAIIFILYEDSYTQIPQYQNDFSPTYVKEFVDRLFPPEDGDCPPLVESIWQPIKTPLSDLQLIFYSEEIDLDKLTKRTSYVLVGLVGGVSVIILAITIFWGLKGSAFNK